MERTFKLNGLLNPDSKITKDLYKVKFPVIAQYKSESDFPEYPCVVFGESGEHEYCLIYFDFEEIKKDEQI